jgi:hypothetical protein
MLSEVPRFLRDPQGFLEGVQKEEGVKKTVLSLAGSALLFLVVYGFVLGLSHSFRQALSSAVKMPLLFLATLVFCLPALHFFSLALLSTRLKMVQVSAIVLAGIGVTAFLLLGLSPVTLFFVLTSGNYAFFQLLAVVFVAVSGTVGLYYLWRGMTAMERASQGSQRDVGRVLLTVWILLYIFVSSQMTWRLSPLIGDPEQPFVYLRPSRDNFFVDVIHALQGALGVPAAPGFGQAVNGLIVGSVCVVPLVLLLVVVRALLRSRPTREEDGRI